MAKLKQKKYQGFTMIEMLITMVVLMIIFLAVGSLVNNMIKASNTVSSRMLVREESEYFAEVFRKYIRNSRVDNVKLYHRDLTELSFNHNLEVVLSSADPTEVLGVDQKFTEIHIQSTDGKSDKVICIGFFSGYLVRSVGNFQGWLDYQPEDCFPRGAGDEMFRKNFVILNTDLISVEGLSIEKHESSTNIYYSIDIDVKPAWGVGGASNYRTKDGSPIYRKSFVVQTRRVAEPIISVPFVPPPPPPPPPPSLKYARGGCGSGNKYICTEDSSGPYDTVSACERSGPFGCDPKSLSGVSFYNGTPETGMIVFKTVGSYTVPVQEAASVEVLVVAGGGGGGHHGGGGGGAGGLRHLSSHPILPGSTSVVVGAGGNRGVSGSERGESGGNSQFGGIISTGGGGASCRNINLPSLSGGSGGGGAYDGAWNTQFGSNVPGSGIAGQGHAGGWGPRHHSITTYGGGGGGGAGAVGSSGGHYGGRGGDGLLKFGFWYAGGGGGGSVAGASGAAGGNGGGGHGVAGGTAGVANTGGGGGGNMHGGSGIVIVRWGGYTQNYNPTTNAVW